MSGVEVIVVSREQLKRLDEDDDSWAAEQLGVLDPRPCKGNANVCAAEGCFGEACVRGTVAR